MTATLAKLKSYVDKLVEGQQQRVKDQLDLITDRHRHLLAVRGYIRFASRINTRWAMTSDEERRYRASPEFLRMQRELRSIISRFARNHPGYSVSANDRARSLDQQRRSWNSNDTVLALGQKLEELARNELDRKSRGSKVYPDTPTTQSVTAFRRWISRSSGSIGLRATVVRSGRRITRSSPTVATPGLSAHGRIRALDFVIRRGGRVIAGTNSAQIRTIWRGPQNWSARLHTAINAVSRHWDGPLRNPDEPWHYEYNP